MKRDTSASYIPSGYCPRCDYPTEEGQCTECGYSITLGRLRSKPRGWLLRHVRLVIVFSLLSSLIIWFSVTRPAFTKYLPTFYLLQIQSIKNPYTTAAAEELSNRFVAGSLTQTQQEKFIQQWAGMTWSCVNTIIGISLYNTFSNRGFPTTNNLPLFAYEEIVQSVEFKNSERSYFYNREDLYNKSAIINNIGFVPTRMLTPFQTMVIAGFNTSPSRTLSRRHGFYDRSFNLNIIETGKYELFIDSEIVVYDLGSEKEWVRWKNSYVSTVNIIKPEHGFLTPANLKNKDFPYPDYTMPGKKIHGGTYREGLPDEP